MFLESKEKQVERVRGEKGKKVRGKKLWICKGKREWLKPVNLDLKPLLLIAAGDEYTAYFGYYGEGRS